MSCNSCDIYFRFQFHGELEPLTDQELDTEMPNLQRFYDASYLVLHLHANKRRKCCSNKLDAED